MNTLEIKQVSKVYSNGTQALTDISLNIQDGMYGLLGPNGAGKSSFMRTIAGLQKPSAGQVFFNQKDVLENPQHIRKHLGYLPQEFGVYPKMSALDLLNHIAILKGILDDKKRNEQVLSLLDQTNLYAHRKKSVSTYSGGMKRRFGIAQALLGNPKIVMVDEPTAGLDPEERNRFLDLLSEISSNIIVLLSTHIVEDVRVLCSKMAILIEGSIFLEGKPEDLIRNIQGKVWNKHISKEELPQARQSHQVIATRLQGGRTNLQVYSDSLPAKGFLPVQADLEHVYFHTLTQSQGLRSC